MLYTPFPGIVVQSVRAPPCQGGSCGFEPRQSRPRIRWIHQLISPFSAKRGDKEQDLIPGGSLFLSCFSFRISHRTNMGLSITSTSTDWWGETYVDWSAVSPYSDFKRDPTGLSFSIAPGPCNRVLIRFPGAHTQIVFIYCTIRN